MFKEIPNIEGKVTPVCFKDIGILKGDDLKITGRDGSVLEARFFGVRNTATVEGGILEYLPHDQWSLTREKGLNYYLQNAAKVEYKSRSGSGQ